VSSSGCCIETAWLSRCISLLFVWLPVVGSSLVEPSSEQCMYSPYPDRGYPQIYFRKSSGRVRTRRSTSSPSFPKFCIRTAALSGPSGETGQGKGGDFPISLQTTVCTLHLGRSIVTKVVQLQTNLLTSILATLSSYSSFITKVHWTLKPSRA